LELEGTFPALLSLDRGRKELFQENFLRIGTARNFSLRYFLLVGIARSFSGKIFSGEQNGKEPFRVTFSDSRRNGTFS